MGSQNTREKVLDTAERLFAENGFDSTTMRHLVSKAGVNLAAIHYHFGSKQVLLDEVILRRQIPIDEKRLSNLKELENRAKNDAIGLEALIEALIDPLLECSRDLPNGRHWLVLLMRLRMESRELPNSGRELHQEMFRRYVDAFSQELPQLPSEELAYRVYFLAGSVAHALVDTKSLPALGYGMAKIHDNADNLRSFLIRFFSAALQAPSVVDDTG